MLRRASRLAALAVLLLFATPSWGGQRGDVPSVDSNDIIIKAVKSSKNDVEDDTPNELITPALKLPKLSSEDVDVEDILIKESRVPKVVFEGMEDLPKKKQDEEDDSIVDSAVKKAEGDLGPPGEDHAAFTQQQAQNEGSTVAAQQALDQGVSPDRAKDIGERVRQRIADDYGRAEDGGSFAPPPAAPAPAPAAAPGETLPTVLEPPPEPGANGEQGPGEQGGPQVIDVPQQP